MNKYDIEFYFTPDGKEPFQIWLDSIKDECTQIRIVKRLDRIREGNFGDSKPIAKDLFELKFKMGPGYRIYYTIDERVIVVLLTGGDKSTQSSDIEKAKKYLKEYKGEK